MKLDIDIIDGTFPVLLRHLNSSCNSIYKAVRVIGRFMKNNDEITKKRSTIKYRNKNENPYIKECEVTLNGYSTKGEVGDEFFPLTDSKNYLDIYLTKFCMKEKYNLDIPKNMAVSDWCNIFIPLKRKLINELGFLPLDCIERRRRKISAPSPSLTIFCKLN